MTNVLLLPLLPPPPPLLPLCGCSFYTHWSETERKEGGSTAAAEVVMQNPLL
jgi:hypothetical protein